MAGMLGDGTDRIGLFGLGADAARELRWWCEQRAAEIVQQPQPGWVMVRPGVGLVGPA